MKLISDVIAELAMILKEQGDVPLLVSGGDGEGVAVQSVRSDSVAQIASLDPGSPALLHGTADEDGRELTVGGMRLDGREPVAVLRIDAASTETFGDWVRARRLRLGLTQRELGLRAGLSQSQVSKIESDERIALAKEKTILKQVLG